MDLIFYACVLLQHLVLTSGLLAAIVLPLVVTFFLINTIGFTLVNPTQRTLATLRRGKRDLVHNVPVRSPFHPDAYAEPELRNDSFFRWVMWLVDEVFAPAVKAIASAGLAFVVRTLQDTCSIQNLKARVAPLGTRLKRGIAQVATLQDAFTCRSLAFSVTYRYFCPAACLFGMFAGLVFAVGTPVGATTWFCSGGFLLVVAGYIGASDPQKDESEKDGEEVDDTPLDADASTDDIAGSAPTAGLQAQV